MTHVEEIFLSSVTCGLLENSWNDIYEIDDISLVKLFLLAQEQEILPLIADTIFSNTSYHIQDNYLKKKIREQVLQTSVRQIIQTNEFLTLILDAQSQGLNPVVIKGIICRSLYPKPMLRPSVDEDLLIPSEDTERWHKFLLAEGLFADEPDVNRSEADELSYHRRNSPTYIELHKSLFSQSSAAYSNLNALFDGVFERTVNVRIEDVNLRTLSPTDHFLYLLCHAYKHFLHSGMGIRQVADMALFANTYGEEIDWDYIYTSCQKVHIETFAAALLQIAHKHLTLKAIPDPFNQIKVDEEPLLEDILTGGLYGVSDIDRAHSSNITLDAVAAKRQGRKQKGLLKSLFPGRAYLQRQFPYAKEHPVLLPLAWANRILNYLTKRGKEKGNPARTLQIGQDRVELLKQYKIL